MKTIYQSEDGKLFNTTAACLTYETNSLISKDITHMYYDSDFQNVGDFIIGNIDEINKRILEGLAEIKEKNV